MKLKGTHGTCKTWGEQIQKAGFKNSNVGRAGPGCYFWRFYQSSTYAKSLANRWWELERKKGNYNDPLIDDKGCCLFSVSIDIEENNILDLSSGELREELQDLILETLDANDGITVDEQDKLVSGLYALYVEEMQKELNHTIQVVIADVAIPKKFGLGPVGLYFGTSTEVLVVLDPACIEIDEVEMSDE